MTNPKISMPIAAVEMQEFLFSKTLAKVAGNCADKHGAPPVDWSDLESQIRQSFRLQRFSTMNWLLMNGVSIPAELLSDQTHSLVGQQLPDLNLKDVHTIKTESDQPNDV